MLGLAGLKQGGQGDTPHLLQLSSFRIFRALHTYMMLLSQKTNKSRNKTERPTNKNQQKTMQEEQRSRGNGRRRKHQEEARRKKREANFSKQDDHGKKYNGLKIALLESRL